MNKFIVENKPFLFCKQFKLLIDILFSSHVNALVRASTARLLLRLLKLLGASRILALRKEKRELIFSTVIKLSYDGNMETRLVNWWIGVICKSKKMIRLLIETFLLMIYCRSHAKNIILLFADNGRLFNSFCETLPRTAIVSINKFLSAAKKKWCEFCKNNYF